MKFESIKPPSKRSPIEEYEGEPILYDLLRQLPEELIVRHTAAIEKSEMSDEEAAAYLKRVLEKREGATRISEVSDENLRGHFAGREEEVFSYIEGELSLGDRNLLGKGGTAKVKAFRFEAPDVEIPMAVKYLETPLRDTLTAQAEHDMLVEVERLQQVERLEKKDAERLRHVRVPHPYFHYKSGHVQCYGMELIGGLTLHEASEEAWANNEQRERIQEAFRTIPLQEVLNELEIFFRNMHEFCLHGDVKAANIMVDENGTLYIIDFGQSKLVTNLMKEDHPETKKEDELVRAREAVRRFYHLLSLE
jgi:serine/threonine-protein kinase RIO1